VSGLKQREKEKVLDTDSLTKQYQADVAKWRVEMFGFDGNGNFVHVNPQQPKNYRPTARLFPERFKSKVYHAKEWVITSQETLQTIISDPHILLAPPTVVFIDVSVPYKTENMAREIFCEKVSDDFYDLNLALDNFPKKHPYYELLNRCYKNHSECNRGSAKLE
jgi:hypothetical protein